jgi:hypothetical protein
MKFIFASASARLMLSVVLAALSAGVHAQTMYRCNNSYQERPCESGAQSVLGKVPSSAQKSDVDLSCTRRGEEAKKIIWSREGGASQEKLMAETNSGERRKLIADVYALRADANAVRAAIEKDCMAEKTQPRVMLDGVESDQLKRNNTESKNSDAGAGSSSSSSKAESKAKDTAQCFNLKSRLQNLRLAQAAGGSAAAMESLNQQKRALLADSNAMGCDSLLNGVSNR